MMNLIWKEQIKSYIFDWIIIILLAIPVIILNTLEPNHRPFSLQDKTISYPIMKDTFPNWVAIILSIGIPLLTISFYSIRFKSIREFHHGFLGLFLSVYITLMLTVVFKITIGRHRPDWLSRCIPALIDGLPQVDPPYGLSTIEICTQTDKAILKDGQMSFLSGHSSLSFSGLFYCSLYLSGKLKLFDRKGYTIKTFIVIAPSLLALIIAISRIHDFRHHWQDVICGSLLGIVVSTFAYLQYFPSIFHPNSNISYETRLRLAELEEKNDENHISVTIS